LTQYSTEPGSRAMRETNSSSWLARLIAWARFINFIFFQRLVKNFQLEFSRGLLKGGWAGL